jgi:hypothetical protein
LTTQFVDFEADFSQTVRRLTELTVLRKRSAISKNHGGELFHPEEERSCLMFN